ncbi:uncharacterized protein LOC134803404 isoform X2 [Cydia splendana]|uniref:uncharacterized protein LOC134803404 isoform X2 n=1 Tax=Cydia splendana TaxID=1100963 RepID=UPI0028F49B8B
MAIFSLATMPLVRSLALIALVTVVAAFTDSEKCVTKDIGIYGDHRQRFVEKIPYGKTRKDFIGKPCKKPDKWVGEQVDLCNVKNTTKEFPSIEGPPERKLTPVNLTCKDHDGCDLAYVYQCMSR